MLLPPAKRSASALYGEVLYTGQMSFPRVAVLSVSPAVPTTLVYATCLSFYGCGMCRAVSG